MIPMSEEDDRFEEELKKFGERLDKKAAIRIGLDSTKVRLTEVGKKWVLANYTKGIVWEYDENDTWDLKSMGVVSPDGKISVDTVVLLYLGIPYRIPV